MEQQLQDIKSHAARLQVKLDAKPEPPAAVILPPDPQPDRTPGDAADSGLKALHPYHDEASAFIQHVATPAEASLVHRLRCVRTVLVQNTSHRCICRIGTNSIVC